MPILTPDYSNINFEDMAGAIGLKAKHVPMLIASFMDESSSIMESLKNAIADNNFSDIKSYAHSIKGSAGNLKFDEIYEMARDMELSATDSKTDFDYSGYYDAIKAAMATIPN